MDIYEIRQLMRTERKTIHDLPLRVTYYARVSSTTDAQLNSIDNQVAYFEGRIQSNSNWLYVPGYIDEVRGESVENRAGFLKMVEDAKNGKFDYVYTKEISRFARDTLDSIEYTRKLLSYGVCVFFENDNIDTIEPDSEMRLTIMASIAQDEVRKLSARVKFGHQRAIEDGHVLGNNRLYGYDKKNCRLFIKEEEAEMVKNIFELYVDGKSLREIERTLWSMGYRNHSGGRIMHNTIGNIIKNPKYKGYYCGKKVTIVDYRTKEQKFLPQDEWVMYKDETGEHVPAIVSEEMWEEANRIMSVRSRGVKTKEHSFKTNNIYTGKIYCGIHDVPFWKNSYSWRKNGRKTKPQWSCSVRSKLDSENNRQKCDTFPIFEYELNEVVKQMLLTLEESTSIDYIQEYANLFKQAQKGEQTKKLGKSLQDKINKLNMKKEKLLELNIEGYIDNLEFSKRNKQLNQEIEQAEVQLLQYTSKQENITTRLKALDDFKSILESGFNPDDEDFITKVVRKFIDRIVVTPVFGVKDTVDIDILLNTGFTLHSPYEKRSSSSVHMTKKMVAFAEQALSSGQSASVNNASPTISSTSR